MTLCVILAWLFNHLLMHPISGIIITYNEEENIERCVRSMQTVADEIIVVDSLSTDRTREICEGLGVRFYEQAFMGYKEQKNFALQFASHDYVLSVDADEAISVSLMNSILEARKQLRYDAYSFNRLNNYCGQWILHSNWYPDKKIRLFNKHKAHWGGVNPHDKVVLQEGATVKHLSGDLLHWVLDSYDEHIDKANRFSSIAAMEQFRMGKRSSVAKIIINSGWRFIKAYFLKRGFMDGFNGFAISCFSAYTSFLKYMKLRKLHLDGKANGGSHPSPKNKNTQVATNVKDL
jgi:glycosyltransferase involved in cell wall biosynthesis